MSVEENKALILRGFEEGMNGGDLAVFDAVISAGYVNHDMPAPGPEGFKQTIGMFRAAFPDLRVEVADVIGEGDEVAIRFTMHATHAGDFMGIPPTNKKVTLGGITIVRLRDGKIVERWQNADLMGLMQQLGAIPEGAEA